MPLEGVPYRDRHPAVFAAAGEYPVGDILSGAVAVPRLLDAIEEVVHQLRIEQVDCRFVLGKLDTLPLPGLLTLEQRRHDLHRGKRAEGEVSVQRAKSDRRAVREPGVRGEPRYRHD